MERRERLRRLMASDEGVQEKLARHVDEMIMEEVVLQPKEKFYTEGPTELRAARLAVCCVDRLRCAFAVCHCRAINGLHTTQPHMCMCISCGDVWIE